MPCRHYAVVDMLSTYYDTIYDETSYLPCRYYAVVDMLTTDPADRYGRTTLREHYTRIAKDGQDYDPYTTLFAKGQKRD